MPAIITNDMRIRSADSFERTITNNSTYAFVGGTTAWANEALPPDIIDDTADRISALKEIIGLKKITTNNIRSVIPRYDWTINTVYDQYDDTVNIIDGRSPTTSEFYKFYVFTDEFNVYKCLKNNYDSPSTIKPTGSSVNAFQTSDGYIWKYMYTVSINDITEFMTSAWIPCYTKYYNDQSSQFATQQAAVNGTLDVIQVVTNGANYSTTTPPSVIISGDGTGATATAIVEDVTGSISDIVVTNKGSGYTYAYVSLANTGSGVGFSARAIVSPIGGHGHDARSELGAAYKMIRTTISGNEEGYFPINTSYRRAGLLMNPLHKTDTGTLLRTTNSQLYQIGDTVYGLTSGAVGVVVGLDIEKNWLYLTMTSGAFLTAELIKSTDYNETTVLGAQANISIPLSAAIVSVSNLKDQSGEIMYFSTREPITRGMNQVEELRFVLAF